MASAQSETLAQFLRSGDLSGAQREVEKIVAAGEDISSCDAVAVERIGRIGGKFADAQPLFNFKPSEMPVNAASSKMKMEWGLQIDTKQAMLRMMSTNDYDFDMAVGIASRFEKDLEHNFDSNVVAVEPLGENHPTDMIWRKQVQVKAVKSKTDDIIQASLVNNLAEDGSVWLFVYTPNDMSAKELRGATLPEVAEGHTRNGYIMCANKFTPLRDEKTGKISGFREVVVSEIKLSSGLCKALSWLPNMVLRSVCRGWFEGGIPDYVKYATTNQDLSAKMTSSVRAELYADIRKQMSELESNA